MFQVKPKRMFIKNGYTYTESDVYTVLATQLLRGTFTNDTYFLFNINDEFIWEEAKYFRLAKKDEL